MGFETGIDVDALVKLRALVGSWIPEETLTGAIARAGLPKTYRIDVLTRPGGALVKPSVPVGRAIGSG
jgi:hypothetical protein